MTGDTEVTVAPSPSEGLVLPLPADPAGDARRDLADQLVEEARVSGVSLVGPAQQSPRRQAGGIRSRLGLELRVRSSTSWATCPCQQFRQAYP